MVTIYNIHYNLLRCFCRKKNKKRIILCKKEIKERIGEKIIKYKEIYLKKIVKHCLNNNYKIPMSRYLINKSPIASMPLKAIQVIVFLPKRFPISAWN